MIYRISEHLEGHHPCKVQGHHMCSKPSGRKCVDCGTPAGTLWGPHWCMDCDSRRLERLDGQFAALAAEVRSTDTTNENGIER